MAEAWPPGAMEERSLRQCLRVTQQHVVHR